MKQELREPELESMLRKMVWDAILGKDCGLSVSDADGQKYCLMMQKLDEIGLSVHCPYVGPKGRVIFLHYPAHVEEMHKCYRESYNEVDRQT